MKKLIADKTVGKLAKWLRILGIPCEMQEIKSLKEIPKEAILFTRSRRIASSQTILLESDKVEEQLKFVFEKLPELKGQIKPFSLCLRCNQKLEPVSKEEVFGLVPDYIYETFGYFKRCPLCGRIYWPGSHQKRMSSALKSILAVKEAQE
ncbi:protein of unknown function DUF82 [Thermodesulfatator indicus DSM 15286]|uniref:Mut7-C RNAse domain-containing protein n=1 Tax=Thermodesulfatator indicus (strain DSM 15286 / JCM 11887 / CIR29812) TaxID=667014 RepID=F8A934_THEID|nr:Mut7-C RNAse domain-containing protein [Thermodesulfatator indicus]AEH45162.1 protein of unknown function DUF82 [Thermodesulfatator indicus DSM 15286]